jgi:4'-phosphopantetheinyl transferase
MKNKPWADMHRWPFAPSCLPEPAPGDIHIWQASLAQPISLIEALEQVLSPDERDRAFRFRRDIIRHRFIVARGVLRHILGRYVSKPPQDITFQYAEYGKPELGSPVGSLQFNVSHSHDMALYAFTRHHPIGVDVEYLNRRSVMDRMKIARRFFSVAEYKALSALPESKQDSAFLTCWTRKEAFIKAIGQGLSCPLDQFDVAVDPDAPAALLATRWDAADAGRWAMTALDPGENYIGALVVEGECTHMKNWTWWI